MPTSRSARTTLAALAALTAALLGACSDAGSEDPRTDPPSGSETTQTSDTRVVATDKGDIEVPAQAARVVAADYFAGFTVMDLGVEPVGVAGSDYSDQGETYANAAAEAAVVGDFLEVDYEAILATDPDLIVRSIDTDEETYDRLSQIAPTVVISFQGRSLTDVTASVGEALGRSDQATALIESYDEEAARLADAHASALEDLTFALVTPTGDGQWWLYGPGWTDLTVLTHAGLRLAPPADTMTEQTATYSMEELDLLAEADVILLDSYSDNAELESSALWAGLPAVTGDRVFTITTGTSSIGNAMSLLAEAEAILTEVDAS